MAAMRRYWEIRLLSLRKISAISSILWLWITLCIGGMIRLATLGRQSIWLDEGLSFWIANRPFLELIRDSHLPTLRPLHSLVLQPMIALGGSEWLLRLPSALAGIASIALVFVIGKELFDRQTGLVAAGIVSLSPLHVWYSQEARFYALVSALALSAMYFLLRALRHNRKLDWFLLGVFQGLALWTEASAVWFMLGINLAAFLILKDLWRNSRLIPWMASQALALGLYLPGLPNLIGQTQRGGPNWIPPATPTILARTIADFGGSFLRSNVEAWIILIALAIALVVSARFVIGDAAVGMTRYLLAGSWMIVPVGVSFLASQPYVQIPFLSLIFKPDRSIFLTRNLLIASFPLYILLARGLLLARKPYGIPVLMVLLALNAFATLGNATKVIKDDFRAAAHLVTTQADPDDLIITAPGSLETPFAYYYYDRKESFGMPYPQVRDGVIDQEARIIYVSPLDAINNHRHVWLITTTNVFQPDENNVMESLETDGKLIQRWQGQGVTVSLFELGEEFD